MKKILLLISSCLFALTSCEIDNYEAPNASIHGSILDAQTGELVGMDVQDGGELRVVELGFENPQTQSWRLMNTGEYRNNLVFAATYDIRMENNNCYPFVEKDVVVKKGDNTKDFKVTPYIRIKNPKIEKNGNQIVATFSLEGGKGDEKLSSIQLFAFSDMWVGNIVKFGLSGGTDKMDFAPAIDIDPSQTYRLAIDIDANKSSFKYTGKNYFFRIGAKADIPSVGTIRHNYSPLVSISF
ncbi:DUF3823 domain-containing protein [Bacteroides rodentium]|uniref:DUF3823 domain-containing protein n=1 Tax=Bacteroides rodentium TaxID=691816 RepID=UPI000472ACC2|nr:DUF3823 domain-containing protein [Bacteroides rodentium]